MPLSTLLNGSSVDPEQATMLYAAYEIALRSLGLVDRNDPITELVAKKIIEIGRAGVHDPAQISAQAINELGIP